MATIGTTALPTLDSSQIKNLNWTVGSDRYSAYVAILEAESYVLELLATARALLRMKGRDSAGKEAGGRLVAVRVAGHLFLEFEANSSFFGVTPSAALVRRFTSPPQDTQNNRHEVIIDNGTCLRDNFIRAFRTSNVEYPPRPSSHPSSASFDTLEDMINDSLKSTGRDYRTSREKMLARDGYRCVVTGVYNDPSLENCLELGSHEVAITTIEAAHIFNESTMQDTDPAANRDSEDARLYRKTYHATDAMAILKLFGFPKFSDTFTQSGGVHEVWNLISLEPTVHNLFDHLKVWFEYTDKPHHYKVCTSHRNCELSIRNVFVGHDREVAGAPMFVEFDSQYKEAPPPDPFLLALHATCARVAHMSGAAEFFDRVERDAEETRVLAVDGSSGPLLCHLLSPFAIIPGLHDRVDKLVSAYSR